MFWITLRQYMEEKAKNSERNLAHGVLPPFTVSLGTQGRRDMNRHMSLIATDPVYPSPAIVWMSVTVRSLLVKYWIWVVASMLMVMSLGGQRVVIYRIVYMFIFLTFVLMFQVRVREGNEWKKE